MFDNRSPLQQHPTTTPPPQPSHPVPSQDTGFRDFLFFSVVVSFLFFSPFSNKIFEVRILNRQVQISDVKWRAEYLEFGSKTSYFDPLTSIELCNSNTASNAFCWNRSNRPSKRSRGKLAACLRARGLDLRDKLVESSGGSKKSRQRLAGGVANIANAMHDGAESDRVERTTGRRRVMSLTPG